MKNLPRLGCFVPGLGVALLALILASKATAQPSGYALDFSPASNNYVSVNLTAPPASNYTLTAWVKLRTGGTASGTRMAVLSGTNCNSSIEFLIHAWTNVPTDPQAPELGRCGAFDGGFAGGAVPLNTWTHVAVTISSAKLVTYYINGNPAGAWDGTGLDFSFGGTVRLGANNGFRSYDGLLENFQLWNRELSAAEIQTNVTQQLTGSEDGLYAWYPFDEGSGNTATNAATGAGGSTGSLVNNPQWVAISGFTHVPIAGLLGTWRSSVAWGDYDNDGKLDFLLKGARSDIAGGVAQVWRNTGSGFTNVPIAGLAGSGGYSSVAWGDYDNDGLLDFYEVGSDGTPLWRNTGSNFINVPISGSISIDFPAMAWGDYNNDGRLDFLRTGSGLSQLWRNTSNGFANVAATVAPGLTIAAFGSVAWGDYDNDGRLDFLITGTPSFIFQSGVSQLWRNNGNGTFSNVTASAAPGLPGVYYSSVAWADYDNDGNLDFLITGYNNSNDVSQLWRNNGNGTFSNVTASAAPGLPGVESSSVAWGDYDNDGRLDFFLTGYHGGNRFSQIWRNTGSGFTNVTANIAPGLPGVDTGSVAWGDFDNDGRLDFLLTGTTVDDASTSISQLWHNNTAVTNAPPSAPSGLALTATTNAMMLSWNSATDDHTPANGLTYNVRAGTTPGGIDLFAGHVNAADGFRRVPALGNANLRHSLPLTGLTNGQTVYWSVQAVDTAFAGGPFASEVSAVTIPTLFVTTNSQPSTINISWTPPTWGWLLQDTPSLAPTAWSNSPSGELNPTTVSTTNAAALYRLRNR